MIWILTFLQLLHAFVFHEYMGTKAPYLPFIHDKTMYNECQLIQVQFLSRHGTRYPTRNSLIDYDILANYLKQFPNMSFPLNEFKNTFDADKEGELHPKGKLDMERIAQRFNASFHHLLKDPSKVFIQASNKVS